jgi:hypothetical protein
VQITRAIRLRCRVSAAKTFEDDEWVRTTALLGSAHSAARAISFPSDAIVPAKRRAAAR